MACAMKATAWLAVPIIAAMFWSRDGARAAGRFAATSAATAVAIITATAPASLINSAIVQNTVLFPLGPTRHKTPAVVRAEMTVLLGAPSPSLLAV